MWRGGWFFSDFPSLLFEIGAEFPSSNIMIIGFGLEFPPHPPVVLQVRWCLIWPTRPSVYSIPTWPSLNDVAIFSRVFIYKPGKGLYPTRQLCIPRHCHQTSFPFNFPALETTSLLNERILLS